MSVIDSALCTVAGWYWYCDACDTHGNADGEEEAWHVAWAHEEYQNVRQMDDECCDLHVFRVGG
jgi:cation transport regulator ChaB